MWSDKRFIIILVLLVVAIAVGGTLGGIAIARENNNPPRVGIAGLLPPTGGNTSNIQGLIKEFQQARQEIRSEGLDSYLQQLVKEGKITQEQADKIKSLIEARQANSPTFNNGNRIMPFRNMPFNGNQNGNNMPSGGNQNSNNTPFGGMQPGFGGGFGGGNGNNPPAPTSGNNTTK